MTLKAWYDSQPKADARNTLLELCEFVGKSEETIYRWMKDRTPDMANRKLIEEFTGEIIVYPYDENQVEKSKIS